MESACKQMIHFRRLHDDIYCQSPVIVLGPTRQMTLNWDGRDDHALHSVDKQRITRMSPPFDVRARETGDTLSAKLNFLLLLLNYNDEGTTN